MSSPSDSPTRVSPQKGTETLQQTIAMETTGSALLEDSLANITELMKDPLRQSIEELFAQGQPRPIQGSIESWEMMEDSVVINARLQEMIINQKMQIIIKIKIVVG